MVTPNLSYTYLIITLNRDHISIFIVQITTKRLTACANNSISSKYSSNLPNSSRLFFITNGNVRITLSFGRRAIYRGANILPSLSKLSRGLQILEKATNTINA